jgi:hypothetical protein
MSWWTVVTDMFPRFQRLPALLMLPAALAGCTPRSVPASFPRSSPASPDAAEGPAPRVGVALAEDPPLPGESASGWHGLAPGPATGGQPHHDHGHHHHGAQPSSGGAHSHQHGDAPAEASEPTRAH